MHGVMWHIKGQGSEQAPGGSLSSSVRLGTRLSDLSASETNSAVVGNEGQGAAY